MVHELVDNFLGFLPLMNSFSNHQPLPKSPAKSPDPLARERENVDKLVTDLIGGSTLSPSQAAAVAVATKSPDGVKSKPEIKEPSASLIPRAKPVKLVLDVLAPINIKAKVCDHMTLPWYHMIQSHDFPCVLTL